ncbi:MAG: aspartate kinase [Candidatus Obscuribacter sp.]|nr:aspartate kinase [Candidatus Obscuribacter sp.]
MIVMKFGGTSVGSQERFEQVYGLIENAGKKDAPPLVVVSAMSGVTNALIEAANLAVRRNLDGALEQIEMVRQKHISAIQGLLSKDKVDELLQYLNEHLAELESVLRGINYLGELSKRSVDAVSSVGELLSSRVLAEYAESRGMKVRWLDARKIVITDDTFGKANPDWAEIDNRAAEIKALNKQGFTVITQGFIGSTHDGVTTTLGRGGSDYSASIIGVAAGASIIEIWTDVDGMMTADPRVVKNARPISEVSFQEASELAYFGFLAKVFAVFDKHQTPIDLIATSEVSLSLTIDSTESLEAIKEDLQELGELQIQDDTAIVTVVGPQFRERSGIAGEVFSALRDVNILVISGGASEINLSFLVMAKDADRAVCQLHDHFFGD